jgi:hypothetical protein
MAFELAAQGCQMVYLHMYHKSKFGYILEGLGMDIDDTFHKHLVYFVAIWYMSWPFNIYFVVVWCIFFVLVYCTKENLATPGSNEHAAELSVEVRATR